MDKIEKALREAIVEKARWMNTIGLNQGTSGNISARHGDRMLLTPTAIPYETMKPAMIAAFSIDGEYGAYDGPLLPSTEWRFHLDIMKARPEVGAIVHTHSTFATVLAILRKPIPACHYMVAAFGGTDVRVADYATYGTKELAENALKALDGPDRLSPRQPRHDRTRPRSRRRDVARGRTRDDRQAVLPFTRRRRRPGDPA